MKFATVLLCLLLNLELSKADDDYVGGISFHKFRGPVSGQITTVHINDSPQRSVDFVAKPDYGYSYSVEDPETGISQMHEETRDGDAVVGEYRVLQADGLMRIVRYTADGDNGFQASVHYESTA